MMGVRAFFAGVFGAAFLPAFFAGIFSAAIFSAPVFAGPGSDAFSHFFGEIRTFSAQFRQVVLDEDLNTVDDGRGTVRIKRPGKFRWDYLPPDAQHIIGDGERIWLHDLDLEQVTVRDQKSALGRGPALLLAGGGAPKSGYSISDIGVHAGIAWVNLIPAKTDSGFTEVRMGFEKRQLRQMELVDTLGQRTRISFLGIRENAPIADAVFRFAPPPGADVIDQTENSE
ncbi:MAG: outer membrane lipoprotein chaperone LolA [Gammaproteobacteria bacterium]|nr:outer membrane lipoprotein chaperone LolA [Gammaproteobacteria bacterium]